MCQEILYRKEWKPLRSQLFNNQISKVCLRSLCRWCPGSRVGFEDVRGICSAQCAANFWISPPRARRWQGLGSSETAQRSQWTSWTGRCLSMLRSCQSTPAAAASAGKLSHCRAPSKPGRRRRWRRSAWRLCPFWSSSSLTAPSGYSCSSRPWWADTRTGPQCSRWSSETSSTTPRSPSGTAASIGCCCIPNWPPRRRKSPGELPGRRIWSRWWCSLWSRGGAS